MELKLRICDRWSKSGLFRLYFWSARKIARCERGFKAFVAYVQWNARTTYPINNRNILEVDRVIINIGAMMGFDRLFVRVTLRLIYIYIYHLKLIIIRVRLEFDLNFILVIVFVDYYLMIYIYNKFWFYFRSKLLSAVQYL